MTWRYTISIGSTCVRNMYSKCIYINNVDYIFLTYSYCFHVFLAAVNMLSISFDEASAGISTLILIIFTGSESESLSSETTNFPFVAISLIL